MISPENRYWLIRYPNNNFSRPLPEAELKQLFASGGMNPQDEICPGKGYWFELQDVKEMRKHFGNMQMDGLFKKAKDEITEERNVITKTTIKFEPSVVPSPDQPASPIKTIFIILTMVVLILLFVWFG